MIELQEVDYAYQDFPSLKNANLKINEGESVALIGPNGSGKSTILKMINGIVFPNSGKYLFDGETITEKKLADPLFSKTFHRRIGYVFQNSDAQLFCSNVYEEIAFGPVQMQLEEEEVNKRVSDCLKLLGIEHLKHREPYHLSEGEKRKVAIAAVLSLNPEVLVLDEPMDGLDPRSKRFLRDLLIRMNQAGKTLVCATHDFEYIEGIFHQIVVLSEEHTIIRKDSYSTIFSDKEFLTRHNIK